jgi:hypothetical protein
MTTNFPVNIFEVRRRTIRDKRKEFSRYSNTLVDEVEAVDNCLNQELFSVTFTELFMTYT